MAEQRPQTSARTATRAVKFSPPGDHLLIEPSLVQIAGLRKSGKLTADAMAKPVTLTWPSRVPAELLPFIESPTLPKLAEVVQAHPSLYWHPLVVRQLMYLLRLRHDEDLWERLGWKPEWDEEYGTRRPLKQIATVFAQLQRLVEAHLTGLFPGRRIEWKRTSRKPGPKARFRNPHPIESWAEWIDVAWLDDDERSLRAVFRHRHNELRWPPNEAIDPETTIARITALVLSALEQTGSCWWSDWKEYKTIPRAVPSEPTRFTCHAGPEAPPSPQPGDLWLDTSVTPYFARRYDADSVTWATPVTVEADDVQSALDMVEFLWRPITADYVETWKPLDLDDAIAKMIRYKMGRAGRNGAPAYLAYATLAALLKVSPEKIMDALTNFRRPRSRKSAR